MRRIDEFRTQAFRRRGLWATSIVCGIVTLVVAGWLGATAVQSPAQREAAATAPTPGPITADVKRGDLGTTVTATGIVQRESRKTVPVPAHSSPSVVTSTPIGRGESIAAGTAVLVVNGRPVIATPGAFPYFRDLAKGDVGPDVEQFQRALIAAGYPVIADGTYGNQTRTAVSRLYRAIGYPVPSPSSAESQEDADRADLAASSDEDDMASSSQREAADAKQGGLVPRSELMVFDALPASFAGGPPVGTELSDDASITAETGDRIAVASLPAATAATIGRGAEGTISNEKGADIGVRVSTITDAADGGDSQVELTASGAQIPDEWRDAHVLITLHVNMVGRDVLIVPSRAIASDGAGGGTVRVLGKSTGFHDVEIEELGQLDGKSAVRPLRTEALTEDDKVQIGR
jgi:peptidoglycan hydrolase-like protein with peptidoglycan-binding domain